MIQAVKLKRKELPPIALISYGGEVVEKPTSAQILSEIDMTVMASLRVIYELFMGDNGGEDFMAYPKGVAAVSQTLFTALERYEQLSGYLNKPTNRSGMKETNEFWDTGTEEENIAILEKIVRLKSKGVDVEAELDKQEEDLKYQEFVHRKEIREIIEIMMENGDFKNVVFAICNLFKKRRAAI